MRFRGEPVLVVAEVETSDGISVLTRSSVTSAVTPTGRITSVHRTDDLVHYRAADYRRVQPARIPVLHRHDRRRQVGVVEFLRWVTPPGRVVAVATVDGDEAAHWMADGDCFVSPGVRCQTRGHRREDIELDHVALVEATARVAARPVTWVPTTFEERRTWANTMPQYRLLVEAAEACKRRRSGAPIEIVGHPDALPVDEPRSLFRDVARPIPFDERVGAAVRAGANPWQAMHEAAGHRGGVLWDDPATGWTYGVT